MADLIVGAAVALVAAGTGLVVGRWLWRDPGWLCVLCGRNAVDRPNAVCEPCFDHGGPQ